MKSFIAILALVAVAAADVPYIRSPDADATIVSQDADVLPDKYQLRYETSNGISAQESGALRNVGLPNEGMAASGTYSYPGDDGVIYTVTWVADENGFQAQGAHLPVAPEIPEAIVRAIAYNLANAKPESNQRS